MNDSLSNILVSPSNIAEPVHLCVGLRDVPDTVKILDTCECLLGSATYRFHSQGQCCKLLSHHFFLFKAEIILCEDYTRSVLLLLCLLFTALPVIHSEFPSSLQASCLWSLICLLLSQSNPVNPHFSKVPRDCQCAGPWVTLRGTGV